MARSTAGPPTSCPFILSDVLELEARMCNSFRVPHSRVHRRCGMSIGCRGCPQFPTQCSKSERKGAKGLGYANALKPPSSQSCSQLELQLQYVEESSSGFRVTDGCES